MEITIPRKKTTKASIENDMAGDGLLLRLDGIEVFHLQGNGHYCVYNRDAKATPIAEGDMELNENE